jgi:hypothetical protein
MARFCGVMVPEITKLARNRILDSGNLATHKELQARIVKLSLILVRAILIPGYFLSASSLCKAIFSSNDMSALMLSSRYSLRVWPLLYARSSSSLAYGSSSSIVNFIGRDQNRRILRILFMRSGGATGSGGRAGKSCASSSRPVLLNFCCMRNRFNRRTLFAAYSQLARIGHPSASIFDGSSAF